MYFFSFDATILVNKDIYIYTAINCSHNMNESSALLSNNAYFENLESTLNQIHCLSSKPVGKISLRLL